MLTVGWGQTLHFLESTFKPHTRRSRLSQSSSWFLSININNPIVLKWGSNRIQVRLWIKCWCTVLSALRRFESRLVPLHDGTKRFRAFWSAPWWYQTLQGVLMRSMRVPNASGRFEPHIHIFNHFQTVHIASLNRSVTEPNTAGRFDPLQDGTKRFRAFWSAPWGYQTLQGVLNRTYTLSTIFRRYISPDWTAPWRNQTLQGVLIHSMTVPNASGRFDPLHEGTKRIESRFKSHIAADVLLPYLSGLNRS